MLTKVETFLATTIGRWISVCLLVAFAYWFGGHNAIDKRDAVDGAVNNVATQATKLLTDSINTQVNGINARLQGDSYAVQLLLQGGIKDVNDADARLRNIAHPGVYVKASPDTAKTATPGTTASRPGNPQTYRAELSDESRAFFAGEAARAQTCAVRLQGAQATIISWQRAVDDYNRTIALPAKTQPVTLPASK